RHLRSDELTTASALGSLAIVQANLGDPKAARLSFEQALANCRRERGEHPLVGWLLLNMGQLLADVGNPAEARSCFEQALSINRKTLGEDHPATFACLDKLERLLTSTGEQEAARAYYRQILAAHHRAAVGHHSSEKQTVGMAVRGPEQQIEELI